MTTNIDVSAVSFEKLISSTLKIPPYQRAYTWKKDQVQGVLDDLIDFSKEHEEGNKSSSYYMGSVILHKDNTCLNIIDGQQRIITLLLLAKALELTPVKCAGFSEKLMINNTTSNLQIKNNYAYILSFLDKNQNNEVSKQLGNAFNYLYFTRIITLNLDDAFTFFDTQNSRGVQPSVTVLLKAFHLRAVAGNLDEQNTSALMEEQKLLALSWDNIQKKKTKQYNLSDYTDLLEWLIQLGLWRSRRWTTNSKQSYETFSSVKNEFTKRLRANNCERPVQNKSYPVFYKENTLPHAKEKTLKFSIKQPLYQGAHFFQYINHYGELFFQLNIINLIASQENKKVCDLVSIHQRGSQYIASFFSMILLVYYDRFRESKLKVVIKVLSDLMANFRLISSRVVKASPEIMFIRCEKDKINIRTNLIDLICSSFDSEEVLEKLKEIELKNIETEMTGIRKNFKKLHDDFWDGEGKQHGE